MSLTRLEKYLPPAFITMFFVAAYGIFYAYGMPLLMDPDTPWHIATGYKILELGKLPASDPWSYTAGTQPWYITSWAWDVVLASVHRIGGSALLFIFVMAVAATALALLAYSLLKRGTASVDAVILTVVMAGLTLMDFATARPHLITFIYILCVNHILFITRHERNMRYLAWLPLIAFLWVNSHSSFFIMFSFLGAYLLEALLMREGKRAGQLILISAFCFMALYLNPYGKQVYSALLSVFASPLITHINEWQPFTWDTHYGTTGWLFVFVFSFLFSKGRIFYADAVISFLWLIALIQHQRNACIFVLVSAPFMATTLQGILQRFASLRVPREDISKVIDRSLSRGRAMLIALFVLVMSFIGIDQWHPNHAYEMHLERNPEAGVAFLQERCEGKHFLSDYNLGGYVIFRSGGKCGVFIDGREGTAYPAKLLHTFLDFSELKPGWWEEVNAYKIDGMLLDNRSKFVKEFDAGHYRDHWDMQFHNNAVSFYMRK